MMTPPVTGWHVETIKAELRKRFGPLSALSVSWQLSPGAISSTLARPGQSRKTEQRIAEALGKKPQEIWPDRWHPDGTPVNFRVDRSPSRAPRSEPRQKGRAA